MIAGRERELATIQARINDGHAKARQLPEFRKQIGELEARLESFEADPAGTERRGDLLRRIQGLATQSNLIIRGFRPQAIATREMHAEWPISLELEGTYHSLGMFLDRVSNFPRFIDVGALVMTEDPPTAGVTMKINCTATTFVLVDAATAAAAAAKKPAGPRTRDTARGGQVRMSTTLRPIVIALGIVTVAGLAFAGHRHRLPKRPPHRRPHQLRLHFRRRRPISFTASTAAATRLSAC